jgi:hypothetical protein
MQPEQLADAFVVVYDQDTCCHRVPPILAPGPIPAAPPQGLTHDCSRLFHVPAPHWGADFAAVVVLLPRLERGTY